MADRPLPSNEHVSFTFVGLAWYAACEQVISVILFSTFSLIFFVQASNIILAALWAASDVLAKIVARSLFTCA